MFRIPLTQTTLGEEEIAAAERVLRRKWLTMGEEVAAFEEEFAALLGARHAVGVSNGTAALEIAYRVAGLGPGDEIMMPALTFIACYNAARLCGARPVMVDVVSEEDLTLSVADVERKITENTRAIVSMPYGGFAPDMEALEVLCRDRDITLIEDACHAPLAELNGRKVGTFGKAATWSFFGNKNLTTGEGGMITTDDEEFARECRLLRQHGMTRPTWERASGKGFSYNVEALGMNARLDELRAAIGREQLKKLPAATEARRRAAGWLREALRDQEIPGLVVPFLHHRGTSAHHLFVVLLPPGADREQVMASLLEKGVQSSIHYPPLHWFTATEQYFAQNGGAEELPLTEAIASRLLTLPLGPETREVECREVAAALARSLSS